ncbi:hypothetical protein GCM10018952_19410 [Streptosporangium vulgare]
MRDVDWKSAFLRRARMSLPACQTYAPSGAVPLLKLETPPRAAATGRAPDAGTPPVESPPRETQLFTARLSDAAAWLAVTRGEPDAVPSILKPGGAA